MTPEGTSDCCPPEMVVIRHFSIYHCCLNMCEETNDDEQRAMTWE